MAIRREAASGQDASLRRVAIVLTCLPPPVASRLLGSLDPQSRKRVREILGRLEDIAPGERQRALQSFAGSLRHREPNSGAGRGVEDELVFSRSTSDIDPVNPNPPQPRDHSPPAAGADDAADAGETESPLAFLESVPENELVSVLAGEHPQTLALVLAFIAPAKAARVLPRLDFNQRQEAISRIGRLGDIPEATLQEMAQHLRARVSTESDAATSRHTGKRKLSAILAEMSNQDRDAHRPRPHHQRQADQAELATDRSLESVVDQMARLHSLRSLGEADGAVASNDGAGSSDAAVRTHSARPTDDEIDGPGEAALRNGSGNRQPAAIEPDPATGDSGSPRTSVQPSPPGVAAAAGETASTDEIHRHLVGLPPAALCRALGRLETRQALLALCGLPAEVADAVIAVLPRSQARSVRRSLAKLGPLRLREIDDAKAEVARVSRSLADGESVAGASGPLSHRQPVAA